VKKEHHGGDLPATTGVEALGLTGRTRNALTRHGIRNLGQLTCYSADELVCEVIRLGTGAAAEIEEALGRVGLSLQPRRQNFKYRHPYSRPKRQLRKNARPLSTSAGSAALAMASQ
jgi:DNA-directed RNA polymerase alpha subunit